MKPRLPTPAERRLWQESNRFTRKKKRKADKDDVADDDMSFVEAMTRDVAHGPATRPSSSRGEVRRGPVSAEHSAPLGPTPILPLRGREKLKHLTIREAARFLKSYPEVEATLDLHGHSKLEAYGQVERFITHHQRAGRRHVAIITGKGRVGAGLLKSELPHWLNEPALRPLISAFAHARPEKGGNGVTHVLLKRHRDGS